MKLSEIIVQLERLIELHGDVVIMSVSYSDGNKKLYRPKLFYDDRFGKPTIEFENL